MSVKTEPAGDSMKASLFKNALDKLLDEQHEASANEKNPLVFKLFKTICAYSTDESRAIGMQFSTLFSQIAYLGEAFSMPGWLTYIFHSYRKELEQKKGNLTTEEALELGKYCVETIIQVIFDEKQATRPPDKASFMQKLHLRKRENQKSTYRKHLRAYLTGIEDLEYIEIVVEEFPEKKMRLVYADEEQDDAVQEIIYFLSKQKDCLPTTLSLVNVRINDQKEVVPKAIVWQPDYLVDVTTISECFVSNKFEAVKYISHRLISAENNPYILAGLIANYFLDQLLIKPDSQYSELLKESFRLYPMKFTAMPEEKLHICIQRVKEAFYILKEVVNKELKGIIGDSTNYKIEPSFSAPPYGIQGRLDLLNIADDYIDIVELKSGSPFRPNAYGLSQNHYVQTLLYNLMVEYAYFEGRLQKEAIRAQILYARERMNPLRNAPRVNSILMKALNMRNRLLMIDHHLQNLDDQSGATLFDRLTVQAQPQLTGFDRANIETIEKIWEKLDEIEKQYLKAFFGYVAREQRNAKLGTPGSQSRPGMSSMWLHSNEDKATEFNLLGDMTLLSDNSHDDTPTLTFRRSQAEHQITNFRIGDVVVLYPASDILYEDIQFEVFKSTIEYLDEETVILRLRSKQAETAPFSTNSKWNIEHDLMESSFVNVYRNLLKWGTIKPRKRKLYLGRIAPAQTKEKINIEPSEFNPAMSEEQFNLLKRMLIAQDYFLLWGPPGTGKTSYMLKNFVQAVKTHTEDSIILLAYTNRAVDEICRAIESIDASYHEKYIRIGSSLSTDTAYKDRLLQNIIEEVETRAELTKIIKKHRIYVSTIASFAHNQELLSIKKFDRAFIDEASQLLDPMLVPVIDKIPRIIFTGDHKQLPAVSAQDDKEAIISNKALTELGFESTKTSIFERLYKRVQNQKWTWAYGQLTFQGRMHQDIMRFPAPHFYDGKLQVIRDVQRVGIGNFYKKESVKPLFKHRFVFVPTEVDKYNTADSIRNYKINKNEARAIAQLIRHIIENKYAETPDEISDGIGVITPYRAQIAQIKSELRNVLPDVVESITVDTVERYQGSARDIIILSFCTQAEALFRLFSDTDVSGVNRKLNVAVTRAREQLILVGNKEILKSDKVYAQLLEYAEEIESIEV